MLVLDSTISRIPEREDNALLVGRELFNDNTSHLYSFDTTVTADYDDHLSNVVEVNVVNFTIELLIWAENVRRGYCHTTNHLIQGRLIQSLGTDNIPYSYPINSR